MIGLGLLKFASAHEVVSTELLGPVFAVTDIYISLAATLTQVHILAKVHGLVMSGFLTLRLLTHMFVLQVLVEGIGG